MNDLLRPGLLALLLLLILSGVLPQLSEAQMPDVMSNAYYYPHAAGERKTLQTLGMSSAKLPEDVVETDDVFRAPLFGYNIKYGLPENINLEAGVATNFITFHFSAGGSWNHNAGRWGLSAGTDLAYWFGKLEQFGFNTTYTGWILYPNVAVGYAFDNFSLSAKGEVVLNLAETSKNGENELSNNTEFYNGWTLGLYMEQPLWKHNYVVLGARATYLKFYYPMWAAFSTFDRTYYIPEFTIKFIL